MSRRSMFSTATTGLVAVLSSAALVTGCSATGSETSLSSPRSEQACAAPHVTLSSTEARRGETLEIDGSGWLECDDVGPGNTVEPWEVVEVEWIQGRDSVRLADLDVEDGEFSSTLTVPDSSAPGKATLRLTAPNYETELRLTVRE